MLHLSYEEENDRIYTEEYGKNSVSIHISFHEAKVLTLRAPEFGHSLNDASNKHARDFERRFKYSKYQYA
jgi:hypothetical protein